MPNPLLPKHGGYRRLKTFQLAQLVYDITTRFCNRYIDKRSRTHDQIMVQAARFGVQNIAEGSQAIKGGHGDTAPTDNLEELKPTNLARASLEELRLDYEDFLRQRGLVQWDSRISLRQEMVNLRPESAEDVSLWVKGVHDRALLNGQGRRGRRRGTQSREQEWSTSSTSSTLSTQTAQPYRAITAIAALVLRDEGSGDEGSEMRGQAKTIDTIIRFAEEQTKKISTEAFHA